MDEEDALYNLTSEEYKERQEKIEDVMEDELNDGILDPIDDDDVSGGDFNDPDLITAR